MDIKKQFIRYVSQNMLGMLGMSLYILADTYFYIKSSRRQMVLQH